jgi:hypothetical protein
MPQNQRIIVAGRYPGLERYANELDITVPEGLAGAFEQKLTVSTKSGYAKFL